jgi:hypothetical protein
MMLNSWTGKQKKLYHTKGEGASPLLFYYAKLNCKKS